MQRTGQRTVFHWTILFVFILFSDIIQVYAAPAISPAQQSATVRETFDGPIANWLVSKATGGTGTITQSASRADTGAAAELITSASGSHAFLSATLSDAAGAHAWQERPGTYLWQRARIFIPGSTLAAIGSGQYLTLGRLEATSGGARWELRIRSGGQLFVAGTQHDSGQLTEFSIYGRIPPDRWIDLELGLHSQNGPGVKRASQP
jgi:hypothetical protein